jgi:aromatic-L-amino-acid decarboxylase
MAFFPSNATYPSMLGELFSAALHAPAFNWLCAPAVTELETIVLDWMATLLHLPACYHSAGSGGGVVHGSASEAVLTAMVAARERHIERATARLGGAAAAAAVEADLRGRLVALGSEQAHSCSAKAARVAGVRYRAVPTELADGLAMTGRGLREALAACRAEGLVPFYVTATLGTTATCAVDRFAEIRAVVEADGGAERLWVHVDAAYAGAALVCDEFAHLTAEFDGFDSFDMNMHKWLLTNFDARYVCPAPCRVLHAPHRS